jgi:EAL domain-containing protein (putative c-di-GMP-specific phosphodiesterase class I)
MENYTGAAMAAQRIIEEFLQPFEMQSRTIYSPPSIGIAVFPNDGAAVDDLIKNADTALYHAKSLGGSTYCFFTQEMNLRAVEKIVLETELRQALEAGQFTLYYQPQVNLGTGRVVALEALMRWQHPEHGVILPGEFIPTLEDTGLILRLGEWLLRGACALVLQGQAPFPGLEMSVNISSRQFQQPGFLAMVDKVLNETGLKPGLLTLELTESVVMDEPEKSRQLLKQLRERGLKISIDDFGTGYSSLSYLKNFPIDQLKIDRSFVREVLTNRDDAGIVEAITVIARRLNLDVVAEGIECREQAEFLSNCGCQTGQGYYFAKPLPPDLLWAQLGESFSLMTPRRTAIELNQEQA